jgi:hypothetical protein
MFVTMRDSTSANSRTAKTVGAKRAPSLLKALRLETAQPNHEQNRWTERDDHVMGADVSANFTSRCESTVFFLSLACSIFANTRNSQVTLVAFALGDLECLLSNVNLPVEKSCATCSNGRDMYILESSRLSLPIDTPGSQIYQ